MSSQKGDQRVKENKAPPPTPTPAKTHDEIVKDLAKSIPFKKRSKTPDLPSRDKLPGYSKAKSERDEMVARVCGELRNRKGVKKLQALTPHLSHFISAQEIASRLASAKNSSDLIMLATLVSDTILNDANVADFKKTDLFKMVVNCARNGKHTQYLFSELVFHPANLRLGDPSTNLSIGGLRDVSVVDGVIAHSHGALMLTELKNRSRNYPIVFNRTICIDGYPLQVGKSGIIRLDGDYIVIKSSTGEHSIIEDETHVTVRVALVRKKTVGTKVTNLNKIDAAVSYFLSLAETDPNSRCFEWKTTKKTSKRDPA